MTLPDEDGRAEETEQKLTLSREELTVSKAPHVTGRVTIRTVTRSREEVIDEVLAGEHVQIERRDIRQLVDAVPQIRQQGDVTIVPVVEEVLVVEKRLFLKEEVHIRRIRSERHQTETVILREQEAVITRASGEET